MIYSSVNFFIFSLVGCLANSSFDVKNIEKHVSEMKQKFQQENQMPPTFAGKLEKFTSLKFQPLEKSKLEDMVFDEPQENHLRGLRIKDNFLTFTSYKDDSCNEFESSFGELVNYCYNIVYPNSGEKGSYLVKVNKKEKVVVELDYDGSNCKGVPSKVTSLLIAYTNFVDFGTCSQQVFYDDDDDDDDDDNNNDGERIVNYVLDYTSTYPVFSPKSFVSLTYPESYCSNEYTHYSSYVTYPLSVVFPTIDSCIVNSDGITSYQYSTASCSVDGQFYFYYYNNPTCSGEPISTSSLLQQGCFNPNEDASYDDDDAYYETGILETNSCV